MRFGLTTAATHKILGKTGVNLLNVNARWRKRAGTGNAKVVNVVPDAHAIASVDVGEPHRLHSVHLVVRSYQVNASAHDRLPRAVPCVAADDVGAGRAAYIHGRLTAARHSDAFETLDRVRSHIAKPGALRNKVAVVSPGLYHVRRRGHAGEGVLPGGIRPGADVFQMPEEEDLVIRDRSAFGVDNLP